MICILSGNYQEAVRYARSQDWEDSEWFFPTDITDLQARTNFHVVVVGSAGMNVPSSYFERVFSLAKHQGRINRV